MTSPKLLLTTIRGTVTARPPIWIMRQAGRYLPEYRAVRKQAGDFLTLCYTPELAARVSLQPVHRFGFDATIVFSDILLVPHALGSELSIEEGRGPRLSRIRSAGDIDRLGSCQDIEGRLSPVYETIRLLRDGQPPHAALIGFAGSPWTVATYMISGNRPPGRQAATRLLQEQPEMLGRLIDILVDATIIHLSAQIRAGAELVKLFDSWAGELTGLAYDRFVVEPNRRIITAIRSQFPDIPVILFPRGSGTRYRRIADTCGADCIAIDQMVEPEWARDSLPSGICLQGNLDPALLVEGGDRLRPAVRKIINAFSGRPHVFNLGHGITPDARIAELERVIDIVRAG